MTGERELVPRREDPNPHRPAFPRRQHEDGLGEAELERQRLHRQLVEVAGVGEDGELVAGERGVREDVGDDVAERAHSARNLSSRLVRLILVRHAHSDPGDPDELRPLSVRGRDEARALGERLAVERPDLVVSSPLLRARETAAAIAKAAGAELRVDERLAPGAAADDLVAAVEGAGETVVTVGHQPDCSEIALALTGTDPGFPTAGSYELDVS